MNYILNKRLQQLAKKKKKNGFTLVELMVVIVIVGILSAVALPQLNAAQDRAKDSVARSEAISAGKECSVWFLGGEVGETPDGSQYTNVGINQDCTEVTSTSESTDETVFTVSLVNGIPGLPAGGEGEGAG